MRRYDSGCFRRRRRGSSFFLLLLLVASVSVTPPSLAFQQQITTTRSLRTSPPPPPPLLLRQQKSNSNNNKPFLLLSPSLVTKTSSTTATSLHATTIGLGRRLPLPLSTCTTTNDAIVLAIKSGIIGMLLQLIIGKIIYVLLISKRSSSIESDKTKQQQHHDDASAIANYTSHTIVAMGLMILVSYIGIVGWYLNPTIPSPSSSSFAAPATSNAIRMTVLNSPSTRWLASVIAGMFVMWDVPSSILIKQLRKPDVIVHHVVMTIVAIIGAAKLPMHYGLFYFGVSELSSIPLLVYDQLSFILSNSSVTSSYTENDNEEEGGGDSNKNQRQLLLTKLRDRFQVIAALSFTIVRAFLFTKVTFCNFLPDVRCAIRNIPSLSSSLLQQYGNKIPYLAFMKWSSIGFASLQLYWFGTMLKTIFVGGGGGSISDNNNMEDTTSI